jgi:hypothetical protein
VAYIGDENAGLRSRLPLTERFGPCKPGVVSSRPSLQDRLSEFIAGARAEAETAPDGADEYELQKKVRQAETAANIEAWANSPGLQPPK